MQSVFEAVGGEEGLLRLAHAWHARVMADEVVSHAFSHGFHPQHSERLAAYWGEALGGPATYSEKYGDETSVVRIHSGNGVHEEMDRRAIACPKGTAALANYRQRAAKGNSGAHSDEQGRSPVICGNWTGTGCCAAIVRKAAAARQGRGYGWQRTT